MKSLVTLGTMLVSVLFGTSAKGVTNPYWFVGLMGQYGRYQDGFVAVQSVTFPPGIARLSMRVIYNDSLERVPLSGYTYTVDAGHETAGEHGSILTNASLARWSFEYDVFCSTGFNNPGVTYTMAVTSPSGNTVTAPIFNMLLASNDNVTGPEPWPTGDAQDPRFFIQDSVNPSQSSWFAQPFNMNVLGTYRFELIADTATVGFGQVMEINVVPTPGVTSLLGLAGFLARRRHR